MVIYAVIDTNVLVSALLTKNPNSATVKVMESISNHRIIPIYSLDIIEEYIEVLHRKKFNFNKKDIKNMIRKITVNGIEVNPHSTGEILPDMNDLVFYEVVMEKRSDDAHLVTGNIKHFPVREYIVTPAEIMAKINML